MKVYCYRLLHDYLFLKRGETIRRSAGGDFYPMKAWANPKFRIAASTVESSPDTFAPCDISDEEWELINVDLTHELE
jgi:hypothetical protein